MQLSLPFPHLLLNPEIITRYGEDCTEEGDQAAQYLRRHAAPGAGMHGIYLASYLS